jgi:hypothetical protein
MANFKKPLVKLTEGLIKGISEQKKTAYRTLSDVEYNELLGGVTTREGVVASDLVYGGSSILVDQSIVTNNARMLEFTYPDRFPLTANPLTDAWWVDARAVVPSEDRSFYQFDPITGWKGGQPIFGIVFGNTSDSSSNPRGMTVKDIKAFKGLRLKQFFAAGTVLADNPNLTLELTWRKLVTPTTVWNRWDMVAQDPAVVSPFSVGSAVWTVSTPLTSSNIQTYVTGTTTLNFADIIVDTPLTQFPLDSAAIEDSLYLLQISFGNVDTAFTETSTIGFLGMEPFVSAFTSAGLGNRNCGYFYNDGQYAPRGNTVTPLIGITNAKEAVLYGHMPLVYALESFSWSVALNDAIIENTIDAWDNKLNQIVLTADANGENTKFFNQALEDVTQDTTLNELYPETMGIQCINTPDTNTYLIQRNTALQCQGVSTSGKGEIMYYKKDNTRVQPSKGLIKYDSTGFTYTNDGQTTSSTDYASLRMYFSYKIKYMDGSESSYSEPVYYYFKHKTSSNVTVGSQEVTTYVFPDVTINMGSVIKRLYGSEGFYTIYNGVFNTDLGQVSSIEIATAYYGEIRRGGTRYYYVGHGTPTTMAVIADLSVNVNNDTSQPCFFSYIPGTSDLAINIRLNPNFEFELSVPSGMSSSIDVKVNINGGYVLGDFIYTNNRSLTVIDELFIPKPFCLELFNNRLLAGGDPIYPKTLFFTRDNYTTFLKSDATELPLAAGDTRIVSINELGGVLYAFGESSTVRVLEISDSFPFYRVESPEQLIGLGTLSPMTMIKANGRLYFLSSQNGFVEFNGTQFRTISHDIEGYIKGVDYKYYSSAGVRVTDPFTQPTQCSAGLASAYYDSTNDSIYLALPYNDRAQITVILKLHIPSGKWSTVDFTLFKNFVKTQGLTTGIHWFDTAGAFHTLAEGSKSDSQKTDTNIYSVLETTDIDFGEETQFDALTLYGTGTVKLEVYVRKSDTATVTIDNITLDEAGTDVYLGVTGRHLRIKLTVNTSTTFRLTEDPIIYGKNNGIKGSQDKE